MPIPSLTRVRTNVLFQLRLPHSLVIIFRAGQLKTISTGNGVTIAYSHTTRIIIEGFSTQDVLVDFMPNLNIPLLGVRGFLSNFILTVDYPKKVFSLLLPDTPL
jgi:hypothetical protein